MPNPSTKNVAAGRPMATGGVLYAPLGTALPVDATTALDAAFIALGYVSEEGLRPAGERAIEKIKAWGGDVIAAIQSSHEKSFAFKLMEIFNVDVNKVIYGADNVTVTAATTTKGTITAIKETGEELPNGIFVFDMRYKGKRMRIVVPNGSFNPTEEDPYTDNALGAYECNVDCLPDDTGTKVYRYFENDDKVAA